MSVGASWLLISGSCVVVTYLGWTVSRMCRWIWRTYQIRCEIRAVRDINAHWSFPPKPTWLQKRAAKRRMLNGIANPRRER